MLSYEPYRAVRSHTRVFNRIGLRRAPQGDGLHIMREGELEMLICFERPGVLVGTAILETVETLIVIVELGW